MVGREPVVDLFDHIVRPLVTRCFGYQNEDGGLPETFRGQPSGGWTSAEVYAAMAGHDLVGLCDPVQLDRLEDWLIGLCERHDGRGLPYYEVRSSSGAVRSRGVVEAGACLLVGLRARRPGHPLLRRLGDWLESIQRPSGGWGIGEDETERVYSTSYALFALMEEGRNAAVARGRAWLDRVALRDLETLSWPFRPGLTEGSALMTALAVHALPLGPEDPQAGPAATFLLRELEKPLLIEEDEFPTGDGRKMSFIYSPRLASTGALLRLCAAPTDHRRVDPRLDGALRSLARCEYQLATSGRAASELPDERAWHFLELLWGYSMCRTELRRLGPLAERRYREHAALIRAELAQLRVVRRAAPPLAELAHRLWYEAELPIERLELLSAVTENLCRFVRARTASWLLAGGGDGNLVLQELRRGPAGAERMAFGLWPELKRTRLDLPATQHHEVAQFLREGPAGRPLLRRLVARRNRYAHRPPTTPASRASLAVEWDAALMDLLGTWPSLVEVPLVTIDEIGHPAHEASFVYRPWLWRGQGSGQRAGLIESLQRLPDHAALPASEQGAVDVAARWVYAGSTGDTADGLIPISPFVIRAACAGCRERHFFLLQHVTGDTAHLVAAECGAELAVSAAALIASVAGAAFTR